MSREKESKEDSGLSTLILVDILDIRSVRQLHCPPYLLSICSTAARISGHHFKGVVCHHSGMASWCHGGHVSA